MRSWASETVAPTTPTVTPSLGQGTDRVGAEVLSRWVTGMGLLNSGWAVWMAEWLLVVLGHEPGEFAVVVEE